MSEPTKPVEVDFNTRWKTAWILGVIFLVLVGWDVYAGFFTSGPGGTISELCLSTARAHPVLPFFMGVLAGHLFWPQQVRE